MSLAFLCLLFLPQTDPHRVLVDPAGRSNDSDRKAALEHFRNNASGNVFNWGAARFLEDFGKNSGNPAIDDVLGKYWKPGTLSMEEHAEALNHLVRLPRPERGSDPRMLLALVHLSALGEAGSEQAKSLGMKKADDRWGYGEGLALYELSRIFKGGSGDKAPDEKYAVGRFTVRYAAVMAQINHSLTGKGSCVSTHKRLSSLRGPANTREHLKALLESYLSVVQCGGCKRGKVKCDRCQGRCYVENQPCPNCEGAGKVPVLTGGGREMGLKTKCTVCVGLGMFKRAKCFVCEATGSVDCSACSGKFWADVCRDCFLGQQKCRTCEGVGQVATRCPGCDGAGKTPVKSQMAKLGYMDPCKQCKTTGLLKTGCTDCGQKKLVKCSSCEGSQRTGRSVGSPSQVYTTQKCGDCSGSGFPYPNVAAHCLSCSGLGVTVVPTSDASKVIK